RQPFAITGADIPQIVSGLFEFPVPLANGGLRVPEGIGQLLRVQVPFASRGGPISAGWNKTAAAKVHTRASAINSPMLEVPGWLDIHRLPKAVAEVIALKITARVRGDCRHARFPRLHAMTPSLLPP